MNKEDILLKKIVVFGTGSFAKRVAVHLAEFEYFVDNEEARWGKLFLGKFIYNPIQLLKDQKKDLLIVIASSYDEQISEQLNKMGFSYNVNFVKAEDILIMDKEKIQASNPSNELDVIKHLVAKALTIINNSQEKLDKLYNAEFKVFSQWGEDGIIQYLINKIEITNKKFIEFGVQDYKESNTRYLLINDNWDGLIIEMNSSDVENIRNDEIYYKYNLVVENSFITKDNINDIFYKNNFVGDIGLLSIDIDGNDYWVWNEINVISPRIIICEYNNVLPKDTEYTIPYDQGFYRTEAHYSNLYYGANLKAFYNLALKKGYEFVGTNSVGTNAFFVRKDLMNNLKIADINEYNLNTKIRESRDMSGGLSFLTEDKRLEEIKGMPLYNIETGKIDII